MIAVTFIMNEDDAEIRIRLNRLGQIPGVHIRMTARLEDQSPPQLVDIVLHPIAPLNDRCAWKARQAAHDDPEWFTACVGFDSPDHSFNLHDGHPVRSLCAPANALAQPFLSSWWNESR
jgi:hypothetical protein